MSGVNSERKVKVENHYSKKEGINTETEVETDDKRRQDRKNINQSQRLQPGNEQLVKPIVKGSKERPFTNVIIRICSPVPLSVPRTDIFRLLITFLHFKPRGDYL